MPSPEDMVRLRYPFAFCYRLGVCKYEIRRPRTAPDPKALVPYVLVTREVHMSPELAWEEAQKTINGLCTQNANDTDS